MSDQQIPPADSAGADDPTGASGGDGGQSGSPPPQQQPPRKRRRRWPWVVGAIIFLLLLLVALTPTIVSLGWVRPLVVDQINNRLDGQLHVNDWSLGWFSGIELSGLRITQNGAQIAQLQHLSTGLTLMDMVRGDFDLGHTKIEGLDFVLKLYPDGRTNFHELLRLEPSKEPLRVPDISGIVEAGFRGTIARPGQQPLLIDQSTLTARIEDIDKAITHDLNLAVRVGAAQPGKVQATGSVKLFENNTLDLAKLWADEKIAVRNVDLSSIGTLLGPNAPIQRTEGTLNGDLTAQASGPRQTLTGSFVAQSLAVSGPALNGDTYRTGQLTLTIPQTVYDSATGQIRTGADGQLHPITIQTDQSTIALTINATQQALLNVLQSRAPGSPGQVRTTANVDLAKLAAQLPSLLRIREGIKPVSGQLNQTTTITLTQDKATIQSNADLTDLAAVNPQGQRLQAQPIRWTLSATSLGGGGAVPDLRDINLSLNSGFATVSATGASLARLDAQGQANLRHMQQELGQFVDFGTLQLAGAAQFTVAAQGQLAQPDDQATLQATLTTTDLRLAQGQTTWLAEPRLTATVNATLQRGKDRFVAAVRDGTLTLQAGNPQQPTIDLAGSGEVVMAAGLTVPRFELSRAILDLAALHSEMPWLKDQLEAGGLTAPQGRLNATARGSWDGATVTIQQLRAAATNVLLQAHNPDGSPVTVLRDYATTLDAAGSARLNAGAIEAKLAQFALSDGGQLLTIRKTPEQELAFNKSPAGQWSARGKLQVAANLSAMDQLLQTPAPRPGALRSGQLAGTLELSPAQPAGTAVAADLDVTNLTVVATGVPLENERATLALRGTLANDLSWVTTQQLVVTSSLGRLAVADATLQLPRQAAPRSPLDIVQKASVVAEVTDLARTTTLLRGLAMQQPQAVLNPQPPAPPAQPLPTAPVLLVADAAPRGGEVIGRRAQPSPPPREQPAKAQPKPADPGPIVVRSGSLKLAAQLARDQRGLVVNVDELSGKQIVIARGSGQFGPEDLALKLAALIVPDPAKPNQPIARQIRQIEISQLAGDAGVAQVELAEPIVIRGIGQTVAASGAVKLDGTLRPLSNLMEALAGQAPGTREPFSGRYSATQRVKTDGAVISLAGELAVQNFAIGTPRRARFTEKAIRAVQQITIDQNARTIVIDNLGLEMADSQALSLGLRGTIADYENQRELRNMRALVAYDAAKLLEIARALAPKEQLQTLEQLKLAGVVRDREILLAGKYPADAAEPLRFLRAGGVLAIDRAEYQGMVGQFAEVPFVLADGIIRIAYPDANKGLPAPYPLNGGKLDIGGLEIAIAGPTPRLSSPRRDYPLLENVQINPEFVGRYLGRLNPLFTVPRNAAGQINVTLNQLDQLPLGDALLNPPRGEPGRARLTFSITDLRLDSPFMALLAKQLQLKLNPDGTLSGSIRDGTVAIQNGIVRSDMPLDLGGQVIGLRNAEISLADNRIVNMEMLIPKSLLLSRLKPSEQRFIRDQLVVPVKGTMTKIEFDILAALGKSINVPGILEQLLNNPDRRNR